MAAIGADRKCLSAATVVKYLGGVKGFFAWCEDEGYVAVNPVQKIKVTKKTNPRDAKYPFPSEQLRRLFQSPMYTGHRSPWRRSMPGEMIVKDRKFWVPLIALFSGMRMSEIIQTRVADVKEQDGTIYFDVNDEGTEKLLITGSARRVIPVHPELVRCGLPEYVDAMRSKNPDQRIFEDIRPGKNGEFSHNFSKFFRRYIELIKAKNDKVSFQRFRHNFKDALRIAEVEDSRQDDLMGHSSKGVASSYGSKSTAPMLKPELEKVTYQIDLNHLYVG